MSGFEGSQNNKVKVLFSQINAIVSYAASAKAGRLQRLLPCPPEAVLGRGKKTANEFAVITDPQTVTSHPSQATLALSTAERPREPHGPGHMSQQAAGGNC